MSSLFSWWSVAKKFESLSEVWLLCKALHIEVLHVHNTDWSTTTLNYWMMVERYPNSRKNLAVQFPTVRSPLYLTENLSCGQLPPVLWRWHAGLLSKKTTKTNFNTGVDPNKERHANFKVYCSVWQAHLTIVGPLVAGPTSSWRPGRRRKGHPAGNRPAGIMAGRLSIAVMYLLYLAAWWWSIRSACRRRMWSTRCLCSCRELSLIKSSEPFYATLSTGWWRISQSSVKTKTLAAAAVYISDDAWSGVCPSELYTRESNIICNGYTAYIISVWLAGWSYVKFLWTWENGLGWRWWSCRVNHKGMHEIMCIIQTYRVNVADGVDVDKWAPRYWSCDIFYWKLQGEGWVTAVMELLGKS